MNSTTYDDGSTKVTYHSSAKEALAEAYADLANPHVVSTSQRMIDVYAPCPCGSGKKFKFCCKSKIQKMTQQLPILKRPDDLGMAEAFVRDRHLEAKFRQLVKDYGIQTIIETGTWRGYTARRMAEFVGEVHTIEKNPELFRMAMETLAGLENVSPYLSDSRENLSTIINYGANHPILYYIDAHWGDDWPLFEELEIIAANDPRCVIVIHDIQVPGKDFKYDTYNGQALTFELVKPYLDKLQFPWRHEFNAEAEGHRVGACFILPIQ